MTHVFLRNLLSVCNYPAAYFQSALKIWSDADKAKKVQRMERQYYDDFFFWMAPDFVKRTILGIAWKEQSERRTSASAVVTEAPGPDAGPRERRSPSASPHIYHMHRLKP